VPRRIVLDVRSIVRPRWAQAVVDEGRRLVEDVRTVEEAPVDKIRLTSVEVRVSVIS
jgi:hypothetical protein